MNLPETEIESLLRAAPQPRPPAGLKEHLLQQLPRSGASPATQVLPGRVGGWLAQWWPALAAACLALACLAVLAVQRSQLNELRRQVETLKRERPTPPADSVPPAAQSQTASPAGATPGPREDLERLRARTRQLTAEVATLEALRAENEKLRARALAASGLPPEEVQPLIEARAKARSIQCVNNLKQLGLAARIWATDHGDIFPPDFLTMSNEIATPKHLVCPEDAGRQPAENWGVFTPANTSYEFLAPSGSETEPMRVIFRCPIHGHVCLADGSVQSAVAKEHPERLIVLDGKLYFGNPPPPTPAPSETAPQVQMDPRMMVRYGLTPDVAATGVPPTQPRMMTPELMWRYGLLPSNSQAAPNVGEPEPEPAP